MTTNITTEDNELETELDDIMEDLIMGHNFDYARKALLEWHEKYVTSEVAKAELAMLDRLLLIGTGRIVPDDRDGWKEFAMSYINFVNSLLDELNTLKGKK